MKQEDLQISWQMQDPPVTPTSWRVWTKADFSSSNTEDALLTTAFTERLPRSTGWRADSSLSPSEKAHLVKAASIYKRGVAFADGDASPKISSKKGSYPVRLLESSKELLQVFSEKNFLVVDKNVFANHPDLFSARPDAFIADIDEHGKVLATVDTLSAAWKSKGARKTWCIVGGGIVTDTAAFAASLNACESTFVPTTLLAMADACIGGKTGVNVPPFGKNLVGHFYFPNQVLVWTDWLTTLPRRHLIGGAFECIKHFLIQGDIAAAERFSQSVKSGDLKKISATLPEIIKVKADVVAEDPAETGKRAILNLGHTLGHAIEGLSQKLTKGEQTILHGEAIGFGLLFSALLSTKFADLDKSSVERINKILTNIAPLLDIKHLTGFFGNKDPNSREIIDALESFIAQDKKAGNTDTATAKWVLLGATSGIYTPQAGDWLTSVSMAEFRVSWGEFLELLNKHK